MKKGNKIYQLRSSGDGNVGIYSSAKSIAAKMIQFAEELEIDLFTHDYPLLADGSTNYYDGYTANKITDPKVLAKAILSSRGTEVYEGENSSTAIFEAEQFYLDI